MNSDDTQQLQKETLRKLQLEKRKKLSPKSAGEKSEQIANNFLKIEKVHNLRNFALYLPIKGEVDTKNIIESLTGSEKNIYLPANTGNGWILTMFEGWKNLEVGPLGIRQPISGSIMSPVDIDVVVFPGVAFDILGNRLGYGSGIYDKLFKDSNAIRVGLAYEEQIVENLPYFEHDLKMNFVVSEKRVLSF